MISSTTIFFGLFSYGAGYLFGNLTRDLRTWKLVVLLLFGGWLYLVARSSETYQVFFFLLGMASHHFGRFMGVVRWARSLSDIVFGMRYRRAFEDIRRREQELDELEQRLREEARRQAYEARDRARSRSGWQEQARNFRQKPGDEDGSGEQRTHDQARAKQNTRSSTSSGGAGSQGSRSQQGARPEPPRSSSLMDHHLQTLGLKPGRTYTPEEIKKAYRAAVKKNHPDVGGGDAAMTAVNLAYEALLKGFCGDKG